MKFTRGNIIKPPEIRWLRSPLIGGLEKEVWVLKSYAAFLSIGSTWQPLETYLCWITKKRALTFPIKRFHWLILSEHKPRILQCTCWIYSMPQHFIWQDRSDERCAECGKKAPEECRVGQQLPGISSGIPLTDFSSESYLLMIIHIEILGGREGGGCAGSWL